MRKLTKFILVYLLVPMCISCFGIRERGETAANKVRQICLAQNKYFQQYGRYGTLSELSQAGLIFGDRFNWDDIADGQFNGYNFEVKFTTTGYIARANPIGYGTDESMGYVAFYVDENNKIKARFRADGKDAGPNDEDYLKDGKTPINCND